MSRGTADRRRGADRARTPDGAVYLGLAMIGAFAVLLAFLFSEGRYWAEALILSVMLIAFLVHRAAYRAYLGRRLPPWQAALARLPLRFAGYGGRGRPLDAAAGHGEARTAILVSIGVWVAIIVVLVLVLLR